MMNFLKIKGLIMSFICRNICNNVTRIIVSVSKIIKNKVWYRG